MRQMTRSWGLALAGVAMLIISGCTGPGDTTTLDDVKTPEDIADTTDAAADTAPDSVLLPETDAGPLCPPEIDPCVPCTADEDCEEVFEDLGICEVEVCDLDLGYCMIDSSEEGTPCPDDDPCNGTETCEDVDGEIVCAAGLPLGCDDGDPCNGLETCETGVGCMDGEALVCDDGDPCDGEETCVQGEGCQDGTPMTCDDGDPCNGVEGCEPEAGCTLGKSLECDDGDPCNGEEVCTPDVGCEDGEALDCDDGNPCTDDACVPSEGCTHLPNGEPGCCETDGDCDDDNPCTNDICTLGTQACAHGPADGACEDGDPCTAGDVCAAGACTPGQPLTGCAVICELAGSAGEVVTCDIGLARKTQDDLVPAKAGFHVLHDPSAASLATFVDQVCLGPTDCLSVNIPSGGTALAENGHTVYIVPELPGDWGGDIGLSIEHVVDSSAPLSSAFYGPLELLQGDAHLLGASFLLAEDIPAGSPAPVVIYNIEAASTTGAGLAVTVVDGVIVTAQDSCGASDLHCFDALSCTEDVCDPGTATCTFGVQEGDCDDGNQCTLGDHCDAEGDCVPLTPAAEGTDCFGDDLCSEIGTCDGAGACTMDPNLVVTCDEAPSACAIWLCDPGTGGCGLLPLAPGMPCDDADPCTDGDACNGGGLCLGSVKTCDDGVDCTADQCDPNTGACENVADALLCDDGNTCTEDVCDLTAGCVLTPMDGACDDGDPCTDGDLCEAGVCAGTWDPVDCGCILDADCIPMDDGDPCTGTWACVLGACQINPSTIPQCPAYAGDCQEWTCDPADGACVVSDAPEGTDCDDGACVVDAACTADGQCVGAAKVCDDGDECTADSCDPATGCVFDADPECGSSFCLCEVSGAAGATVDCPISVVRAAEAIDGPTGADFRLSWDSSRIGLVAFEDDLCYGTICLPKTIPNCSGEGTGCVWGSLFPTGHSIVAVPTDLVEWEEQGTLLFFHPSNPFELLADAWLDAGAVVGDGQMLLTKVSLIDEVDPGDPVCLYMNDPVFSLPSGLTLDVTVQDVGDARMIVVE